MIKALDGRILETKKFMDSRCDRESAMVWYRHSFNNQLAIMEAMNNQAGQNDTIEIMKGGKAVIITIENKEIDVVDEARVIKRFLEKSGLKCTMDVWDKK